MGADRAYRERNYAFGQQLLTLRTRIALTQIALASQLGVNRRSVQKWEAGESYPKAETLQRLIACFLAEGVFTVGQEAEEAAQLWQQASQDAPHPLSPFDAAWFAHLLAERSLTPASPVGMELPEGLVTFLVTDIEGSAQRWEQAPQAMQQALARHNAILHQLTELYGGQVFLTAGNSFSCVFADALSALQSALALQRALLAEPWPEAVAPLRVRLALHSGAATAHDAGYGVEPTLNRLSRVLELSQAGQLLLTQATIDLIGGRWPQGVSRRDLGVRQLRDVMMPLQLWQALAPDLPPPPTSEPPSTPALSGALDARRRSVVDWGEAIAVPTLYGRESELATLQRWVVDERCRAVAILGLGGIGKSSLAITLAHHVLAQFDAVLFRSLRNGPPLADVIDRAIRAVSDQQTTPPELLSDKIGRLVQLLRERRCLLILDNFESILEPNALSGTYRSGYADYGALVGALSEREHQSCLLLTTREKLAELGPLEGRTAPVHTLQLAGLEDHACQLILEAKDISGAAPTVHALARLYGGNPLALQLISEPIHELFGGDVGAFLAMGDAFFNGVGQLLAQQFHRSTSLEQAILYWLAIERELVPLSVLRANLLEAVPQRALLVALESLRRRMLIERGPDQPTFTLQPVILEFLTDQLVEAFYQEIVNGQPWLLHRHALVQATAKEYVRHSQEQLIAKPLLERLRIANGTSSSVEQMLLNLLDTWRNQSPIDQGYGPGNTINLLRLLRGDLRRLNLAQLAIRQAALQGVEMQDSSLASALLLDSALTETFDAIMAVAVSPTGEYWAASSRRGEIRMWAAGGQTLHRVWRAHTDMVWALTFSPDGNTIVSGSWDGSMKLWDVPSGSLRWSGRHTSGVNRIVFAPDGRLLASSANDATVRFWDSHTGTLLHTLQHPGPVIAMSWSRDGRLVASGDIAGVIRLWELQASGPPVCVQTLQAHMVWVNGLMFAPDNRALVSVSWDTTVKLWDVASGRLLQTLSGHTDRVLRVDWSRDGRLLASSSRDQTLRLWDVELGRCRTVLRGHSGGVYGLGFTPDSHTLISGSEDGTLRVWDVADGQCVRVIQGYAPFPYVVDWSPDGQQLVSGGTDQLVTIWDATEQTPLKILSGHGGLVCGVGWSPDGQWLASSEWDNAIRLWEPASGASLRVLQHPDDSGNCFYDLAWSPDGRRLASGTNRHGVQVFEIAAQSHAWDGRQFPTLIRHVAWSPTGAQLAGAGDNSIVYVWKPDEHTPPLPLARHQGAVRSLAWSPDGRWLASGGGSEPGELFVWDLQRGELMGALLDDAGMVSAVAWGASDALVVSGGGDGTLRCWDVQRRKAVWTSQAHQGTVQSLRRSPDGMRLASCGDDGVIMLWDLHSGEHLRTLRRDRPYERMNITELTGITAAQRTSLRALGAVEQPLERRASAH